jgi:hypothetical protein
MPLRLAATRQIPDKPSGIFSLEQARVWNNVILMGVTTRLASPSLPYPAIETLILLRHVEVPETVPLAVEVGGS